MVTSKSGFLVLEVLAAMLAVTLLCCSAINCYQISVRMMQEHDILLDALNFAENESRVSHRDFYLEKRFLNGCNLEEITVYLPNNPKPILSLVHYVQE